ncbi:hypothetical protein EGW08_023764, partial [Elysia chlorotica]
NGIITSPNYPKPYLNLERCFWSIAVEPGKVVRLTFHEFQVEAHPACDHDWVLIFDNSTSRAAPLEKKCGYSIPYPITSKGNQMFVEFESDTNETYIGFRASWAA